jgi:DNA-binding transcriptional regulator YhcF (GntR family)
MKITIDIEAEMPLFGQLVDQIKKTVAQHKLQPGDNLPSIRQLAMTIYCQLLVAAYYVTIYRKKGFNFEVDRGMPQLYLTSI